MGCIALVALISNASQTNYLKSTVCNVGFYLIKQVV